MKAIQRERYYPMVAVLSAAIASALFAGPSGAQDGAKTATAADAEKKAGTPEDETKSLDSVTVVGFRASLEKAIEIKRSEAGVVDAIVAEDIADFPDLNLAESLQRIPGVSITRDAGEGRNISVRGLDSQFTRVRINGMEALTTTGGTDSSGGANRGRGFDFNVFASELFNRITVRKTASANVDEGSLGATVDLQTARPFDYEGFTFAAGGQLGYNDLAENFDPRASMLVSDIWADGKFGALLSVAYSSRGIVEEGHSTVRWDNGTSSGGFKATSPFSDARLATTFHPRIPRYGVLEHEQERLGVTASLQYAPSKATEINLDLLYADFDATRTENFLEAVSFSRTGAGKPQTIVKDGVIDGNGNLVYGVFDDVDVRSEARYDELATQFTQIGLSGSHRFNDKFSVSASLGRSESDFDNPIQTTITLDRANTDNYVWDYRNNDRLPSFNYGFDVADPANWTFANGLSEIRLRPQTALNSIDSGNLEFKLNLSPGFRLTGGWNTKRYEFETTESRRSSETLVPNLPAGTTLADLTTLISLNGTSAGGYLDSVWLIPDIDAFDDLFDIYGNTGIFAVSPNVASARGNNRSVNETDQGFYMQGDFNTDLGGIPLSGNIGVRYVTTEQSSTGYSLASGVPVLTTVDRKYSDTLPSLNLVADLTDEFLIRFAAAKVMARPGLGNLTPGVTVSVSGGNRVVSGGNPLLDPFRADTYDVSLEWYFAEESLLALGLFYKDIGTFVQTTRETRPFNTSGLPDYLLVGTGALPTDDFQFNVPINTPGGPLQGLELSYQQPFSFLPDFWGNFGTQLNYTYVDSEIQYLTSTGANSLNTDLTGLSRNAFNATLYYEGERLSARVSGAYRDGYLTTVPGRNNNNVEGTKGSTNIDASASWKLTEQFDLTFEGLNLTDEYNDQWVDSNADRSSVYHHTGRQYFVGFRFKL
jgi:TonB-dependent receptor